MLRHLPSGVQVITLVAPTRNQSTTTARALKFRLLGACGECGLSTLFRARLQSPDPANQLHQGGYYILKVNKAMEALQRPPTFTTKGHHRAGAEAEVLNQGQGCPYVMGAEGTFMCGTRVKVPAAVKEEWQQQARANHRSAASALHLLDRPIGYTMDNEDRGISAKEAGKSQEAAHDGYCVGCTCCADTALHCTAQHYCLACLLSSLALGP